MARFAALLRAALTPVPRREKTAVPPAARQRRREQKKRRGQLKQQRVTRVVQDE
jgi:ribosome-associated protein